MNEIDKALGMFQKAITSLNNARSKYTKAAIQNIKTADAMKVKAEANKKEANRAAHVAAKIEALISDDKGDIVEVIKANKDE